MRKLTKFLTKHSNAMFMIGSVWIIVLLIHRLTAWDDPFGECLVDIFILLPFCIPAYFVSKSGRTPRFFFGGRRHVPMSGVEVSYGAYFIVALCITLALTLTSFSKQARCETIAIISIYWSITACPEK